MIKQMDEQFANAGNAFEMYCTPLGYLPCKCICFTVKLQFCSISLAFDIFGRVFDFIVS